MCGIVAGVASAPANAALVLETVFEAETQDFDDLGTSLSTSGLDAGGWRLSQEAHDHAFSDATNELAYSSAVTNTTTLVGNYNFGVGSDRAIGFLLTGSTGNNGPRSIILEVMNNTGQTLTNLDLSWDLEKYRASGSNRNLDVTFFHGADGSTWTANTEGDEVIPTVLTEGTLQAMSPPTTFAKPLVSVSGLSIAHGSNYYLRWSFAGVGGSGGSPGVGLDNFSISGSSITAVPEASALALGAAASGLAALAMVLRQRGRFRNPRTGRCRAERRAPHS